MKRAGRPGLFAAAVLATGVAWLWPSLLPLPSRAPGLSGGMERPRFDGSDASIGFAMPQPGALPEDARPPPSPGSRVEALIGSGDPRDAYLAFRLIDRCTRGPAAGRRDEAACRDIDATHLRLRLSLLEAAARAGVPGAVTAWTGEGPFGDKTALTQRPDDPLVVEWVRQAVEMIRAAAGRDDVAAITQLGWLTVHWNMSDAERLSALVNHPAEWQTRPRDAAPDCQEQTCR